MRKDNKTMSKNKDYRKFYNKPKKEEIVNEPVQEEIKEVQTIEETTETPQEETPVEEQKVEESTIRKAKVIGATRVNVRKFGSKDADVITVMSANAEVELLDSNYSGWKKVKTPSGAIGYMMSQFLKEI